MAKSCGATQPGADRFSYPFGGHVRTLIVVAACVAMLVATSAAGQPFPSKPLRLVVPYPPGGSTDIVGRLIGQKMGEALGRSIIVENRPGAGTNIGTEAVARAAPDGYTLLVASFANAVAKAFNANLSFDPERDFAAVGQISAAGIFMTVNPDFAGNDLREFIAAARAAPGKFNYGIGGAGSSSHLATELFMTMSGTALTAVMYKGGAAALQDLTQNRIHLIFDNPQTVVPLYKAGKVKVFGFTGTRRSTVLPEIPTLDEAGVKGYEISAWFGVLAPAKTPPEVIGTLERALIAGVQQADFRERLASLGIEPVGSGSAAFASLYRSEIQKWGRLVRERGIKVE
ncbi:MAG: tripartite tricarboxylate transporter substrate binding protein [Alphaproteobacteria bacterium]|nr:tripartite tricarboxylate transporter substrate binding protein [Alphaproteobacteria bacterium]